MVYAHVQLEDYLKKYKATVQIAQNETFIQYFFRCILDHPSFDAACLNVDTLRIAYFNMKQNDQLVSMGVTWRDDE